MKVILIKDVENLGKKLDVKEVAEGYARNFLIPRNLAEQATPEKINQLEKTKKENERKKEEMVAKLKEEVKKIDKISLNFKASVGEKDQLFGSISERDIKNALKDKGFGVEKILIEEPIKTLGEHSVEVDLGEKVKTKIKVLVEKEG